jgi:membrane protein YqaA with SNARE-associated domain
MVTQTEALIALVASAFASSTLLPGTSDIGLGLFASRFPDSLVLAVGLATLANTAGGMTSYALGRLVPAGDARHARLAALSPTAVRWSRKYGAWTLLFSWIPVAGDALCVLAGWLRLPIWQCATAMAIGKLARYSLIAVTVNVVAP